jgi:hypothetical protein
MAAGQLVSIVDASGNPAGGGTTANPTFTQSQGSGNFAPAQATVSTTATQIVAARSGRNAVTIINGGTVDVFIGGSGVTTTTGALLAGTKGASLTIPTGAAVYGIVATGTEPVSAFETY